MFRIRIRFISASRIRIPVAKIQPKSWKILTKLTRILFILIKNILFNGHKNLPHKLQNKFFFWRNIFLLEKKSFLKDGIFSIFRSDPDPLFHETDQDPYQNEKDF